MRECKAEGCPHIAADGCEFCKQHDEPTGREAEIEAVARTWWEHEAQGHAPWENVVEGTRNAYRTLAGEAIDALDAVRGTGSAARNQEVERLRRDLKICQEDRAFKHRQVEALAARSPQSEDHDAARKRAEALRDEAERLVTGSVNMSNTAARLIAADILTRLPSPQSEDHEA